MKKLLSDLCLPAFENFIEIHAKFIFDRNISNFFYIENKKIIEKVFIKGGQAKIQQQCFTYFK